MPYTTTSTTVYEYGEAALESLTDLKSINSLPQVFTDILNNAGGSPWVDPEFPHTEASVGSYANLFDEANPSMAQAVQSWTAAGWNGTATWIRIWDLCSQLYGTANVPNFNAGDVGSTIARNDIRQGTTGDCWFLSSVDAITMVPRLIDFVVPSDNSTNSSGVYHFRLWYQGCWVDVVVDDYVPCVSLPEGSPSVFTIGSNFYPNNGQAEFWPMLLEKAMAKLNTSYSNIASNVISIGMEALTGGFGEDIEFAQGPIPANLFQTVVKWLDRKCVVGCGTTNSAGGIVGDHAYTVTGAQVITTNDGVAHNLLRLRNPWGKTEWTGDWSDSSPLWNNVSQDQKTAIGFVVANEGEFWMSYDDMLQYYSDIGGVFYFDPTMVNIPNSVYQFAQFNSSWSQANNTAGGFNSPWNNPMFTVNISTDNGFLAVGTLLIAKIYNQNTNAYCIRLFPTGGAATFDQNFFENNYGNEVLPAGQTAIAETTVVSYSLTFNLPVGTYVVVPCGANAGFESNIVVRIYNQGNAAAAQVSQPSF